MPKYCKFKLHDPAATNNNETYNYRKFLVKREMENKNKQLLISRRQEQLLHDEITNYPIKNEIKQPIFDILISIIDNHNLVTKTRITNKLNTLFSGYHCINNGEFGSRKQQQIY